MSSPAFNDRGSFVTVLASLAALLAACGSSGRVLVDASVASGDSSAIDVASGDGTAPSDGDDGPPDSPPTCMSNAVPLTLTFDDAGDLDSMLVPVTLHGEAAYLAIDSGSATTFLALGDDGPDYLADAGTIVLGCERLPLYGRRFDIEEFDGKRIVGVFGADLLLGVPVDLDYPHARLTRYLREAPEVPTDLARVPFIEDESVILVQTRVDDSNHLLVFDLGASIVLLVGQEGRPGDEHTVGGDLGGGNFDVFVGESLVELAGEIRTQPVGRIPRWRYFEDYAENLRPGVDGLYGRVALGIRRVLFDSRAGAMWLGPRVTRTPGSRVDGVP